MASGYIYQQNPLSEDANASEIRVVTLSNGAFDDELVITLRSVILSPETLPQYEALSYVWGLQEQPSHVTVLIDGNFYPLAVTRNLDTALRHLRHAKRDRVLWVDAICIDQGNL
jgi:hypothetical protein